MTDKRRRTAYSRDDRPTSVPVSLEEITKSVSAQKTDSETADYQHHVRVVKTDGDRIVFGVIMRPMAVDAHGEYADFGLVKKTAHDFLAGIKGGNEIGVQHTEFGQPLEIVESSIETSDSEKHGIVVLKGDWTGSVRVNDDSIWDRVEKSQLTGFSIGGKGKKVAITDTDVVTVAKSLDGASNIATARFTALTINEISLVDSPANEISFVVAKRRQKADSDAVAAESAENATEEIQVKTPQELAAEAGETKPEVASTNQSETNQPASQEKPAETPAPAKPAEVPATNPAPAAPVSKAKRFTAGRKATLATVASALAELMKDLSGDEGESDEAAEATNEPEIAVVGKSAPAPKVPDLAAQIAAEVAKAVSPLKDQNAALQKELEVLKAASVRNPPTNSNGSNPEVVVVKRKDDPALFDNLFG